MWPEVEKVKSENRHELVFSAKDINKRIQQNGLDYTIFQLTTLNYLSLSQTILSHIPDEISNLINLQTLVLHTNKLETINEKIASLEKLKILDLSRNSIKYIPESLGHLSQLITLNLNANCIESFPSSLKKCTKIVTIDLSNNQLKSFPDICSEELSSLAELKLTGNSIEEIPNSIHHLPALRLLDLSKNEVKELPGELSDCQKLKDLSLKENPISDRRLLKLIEQCRTKQILDYVKQHCNKSSTPKENNASRRKSGNKSKAEHADEDEVEYKFNITVKSSFPNFKVILTNEVKNVREHFLGCIVNNLKFTEESFKKFIQLQNKLHDNICEKRNVATIATHDFDKLPSGNLLYTTAPPKELSIIPLNRGVCLTGLELFTKLQTEANNLRKEKKRNTYSGIHKYLYLIEGKPRYPCLMNSKDEVISLPPITNSDISKIEVGTKQIFVEVTSSTSLLVCRTIMDTLLREMVLLFEQNLEIVQVKTTDPDGHLKNVYPSKNDLNYDKAALIKIIRDL